MAGCDVNSWLNSGLDISEKTNASDFATDLDSSVEEQIVRLLQNEISDVEIVAEERGVTRSQRQSLVRAFVDPIDGTSNLVTGIRYFSSSIFVLCLCCEECAAFVYDFSCMRLHKAFGARPSARSFELVPFDKNLGVVSYQSSYNAPLGRSMEAQRWMWDNGATRILAMWSPNLDFCRLMEGKVDSVVRHSFLPDPLHMAGLLVAQSDASLDVSEVRFGSSESFEAYVFRRAEDEPCAS